MESPYLARPWESDPQGKPMEVWVQERGKSESSSVMEGIGVEQTRKWSEPILPDMEESQLPGRGV
jgi:hypothetical protein